MEIINSYHYEAAALIARVFLGCLFFFQGYDALINIKLKNVIATFEDGFSRKGIPKFVIVCASVFTSYSEFLGGCLLILGLFEYSALYILCINLLIASIGFGITNAMWDLRHAFPRLVLILFLLVIPESWNTYSLDHLLFKL